MLAKKTSKSQITLPKVIASRFADVEFFDVSENDGRIVLTPARPRRADEVRDRIERLGMRDNDIADAVAWARRR